MIIKNRIHEWLADRISWLQYPNVSAADEYTSNAARTVYRFKHSMSSWKRLDLVLMSSLLLVIGVVVLGVTVLFVYLLIAAMFS